MDLRFDVQPSNDIQNKTTHTHAHNDSRFSWHLRVLVSSKSVNVSACVVGIGLIELLAVKYEFLFTHTQTHLHVPSPCWCFLPKLRYKWAHSMLLTVAVINRFSLTVVEVVMNPTHTRSNDRIVRDCGIGKYKQWKWRIRVRLILLYASSLMVFRRAFHSNYTFTLDYVIETYFYIHILIITFCLQHHSLSLSVYLSCKHVRHCSIGWGCLLRPFCTDIFHKYSHHNLFDTNYASSQSIAIRWLAAKHLSAHWRLYTIVWVIPYHVMCDRRRQTPH